MQDEELVWLYTSSFTNDAIGLTLAQMRSLARELRSRRSAIEAGVDHQTALDLVIAHIVRQHEAVTGDNILDNY